MFVSLYICIYKNVSVAEIVTTVKGRHEDIDTKTPKEALLYRALLKFSCDFFTHILSPLFSFLFGVPFPPLFP